MQGAHSNNPSLRTKKILTILFFVALVLYFLYNIMGGDRGILSLYKLSDRHKILQREVSALQEEHKLLQSKVNRMKPDSLDIDLLEEQVKENLGYAKENETIYVEEGK